MIGRIFIKFTIVAITAVILVSAACAKTIYVRTDGSDSNSGDSWATAKQTVNAAMDTAVSNDDIWVAQGIYQVGILTMKNVIHLYGGFRGNETSLNQRDPAAYATILNGDGSGPVISVPALVVTSISGLTICGGKGTPGVYPERCGGGIYCANNSGASITNCTIKYNAANLGAGIYHGGGNHSSLTIKHCLIKENSYFPQAYRGGGIYCENASATITNNVIKENGAKYGAGIYCKGGTISIINNSIVDNGPGFVPGTYGAGIYCDTGANATISNNIVAFNQTTPEIKDYPPGGIMAVGCSPVLRNNCVYGNSGDDYSGVAPGQGDISQDPMLIPALGLKLTAYHLSIVSPCINAGLNSASASISLDIDGEVRVNEGTVDIGADEYWRSETYYVNGATGSDSNTGLSWESAKKTVGAALKATNWQDRVWVAKGTYVEHLSLRSSVQLYGGFVGNETAVSQRPKFPRPTPDPNASILDGNMEDTVVTSMSDASPSPTIDGFVIRKGYGAQGGGIACYNDSNPSIQNNTIQQNSAGDGGGIFCLYSSPKLSRNIILSNTAYDRGGGIFIFDNPAADWLETVVHKPEISCCIIALNTAQTGDGGGIFCRGSETNVANNLIARNTALGAGGGIRAWQSWQRVSNNIIAQNTASYGGGIHIHESSYTSITNNTITANSVTLFGGAIDFVSSTIEIINNIIVLNTMGIGQYETENHATLRNNDVWGNYYTNYYALSPGTGDISADPKFMDWSGGDYHLAPLSPCINAGWNDAENIGSYDIDRQPRIGNTVVDIGADEWYATLPPHNIIVTEGPILRPQRVKPGEFVYCNVGAQDSYGQDLTYEWSDGGAGGYFSEPFTRTPIYVAPPNVSGQNKKIILTCFITSSVDESVSKSGSVELTVESALVPGDFTGNGQVTISDATLFVNEWVRTHQTPPPAFDPAIDGPFDLYPHTSGVWPNWTPVGDSIININDATAFIQCWTGSHPSSPASTAAHALGNMGQEE